jgi:hypothetical protein
VDDDDHHSTLKARVLIPTSPSQIQIVPKCHSKNGFDISMETMNGFDAIPGTKNGFDPQPITKFAEHSAAY